MPSYVFVTGSSCCGKSTIIDATCKEYADARLNVSYTSRQPRSGEIDGGHYHFISKQDFELKIKQGFFIEYVKFKGNYYGTSKGFDTDGVSDETIILFDLEPVGMNFFKELATRGELPGSQFVHIYANKETIRKRLESRGIGPDEMNKRMETVGEQIRFANTFEFDYSINTETTKQESFNKFKEIIEKLQRRKKQ